MQKNIKKVLSKVCAFSLAFAMVAPLAFDANSAGAASKPKFAKKTVSVKKGKTVKLSIKGKKIKKTTWSVKSSKIAKLSKKKKTSVTVKGLKKGSATVTAKVKVGKKTYKIKAKVKVTTAAVTPAPSKAPVTSTPAPTTKATAAPTTPADTSPSVSMNKTASVEYLRTAMLTATVKNSTETVAWSSSDSSIVSVDASGKIKGMNKGTATITASITGAKATCEVTVNQQEMKSYLVEDDFNDGTAKYVTHRDASTEPTAVVTDGGKVGKCMKITDRTSTAMGALIDLTEIAEPGATYTLTAWAKLDNMASSTASLILSSQTTAVEGGATTFDNLSVITADKKNFSGAADVTIAKPDEWNQMTFTFTVPDDMYNFGLYWETQVDTACDILVDEVKLQLVDRNTPDYSIKGLRDYAGKDGIFEYIGCGMGYDQFLGENGGNFIKSQFNSVTMGNCFKPDAVMGTTLNAVDVDTAKSEGSYIPENYSTFSGNKKSGKFVVPALDYTRVDQVLEQAYKTGEKLRAHTLIWHQQMPVYFFKEAYKSAATADNVDQATMYARMDYFITNEINHILAKEKELTGGKDTIVYAWDVVNEYFHSHNAADTSVNTNGTTYWEEIFGKAEDGSYLYDIDGKMVTNPEYVKYAFKLAYDACKANGREDISLIYNDYNTYIGSTADDMVEMVNWINEKDDINTNGDKICTGVGMQAHLTYGAAACSVENFKAALDKFVAADFEIQVTELDAGITSMDKEQEQADYYKGIINSLIDANKNGNVKAVIFWSLYDANSWRSSSFPCIFKGLYNPKKAYTSIIEALEAASKK